MPVSPEIDEQIKNRFAQLEELANKLMQEYWEHVSENIRLEQGGVLELVVNLEDNIDYMSGFQRIQLGFTNLLRFMSVDAESFGEMIQDVQSAEPKDIGRIHGMIQALQDDYNQGMLRNITEKIETNVVADFLTQAERLLKNDKRGIHTYGPAAVLAGAVLEDGLRRICDRQSPPISTNKRGGHPKAMGTLIDELKQSNVFNELKAKQLRAWADIRNAAAHGRFNEFERTDVAHLIPGVESFLAEYLS